jgi:hypothetical protein
MYGHEVLMSLQMRAKFFGTHFLHCYVSDIGLKRMTVYFMEKRWQHLQATSLMSDFDMINFPLTLSEYISPLGCQLNSISG